GGRGVLAGGSCVGAVACITLALSGGRITLLGGWVLAGVASAACLYDPAFATLHRISGISYRRAVTALTLFGGFASTVFWPLSQYLLDTLGWRAAFGVYAALHAVVCFPLHALFIPSDGSRVTPSASAPHANATHSPA